jgi:Holliday junction resolvase RusA-like endonuclease
MITRAEGWGVKIAGLTPAPKGSMKCIGARGQVKHQLIEDNPDTAPWRRAVAAAARTHVPEKADPQEPVELVITYSLPRPKSHYGTGRNADVVKASAPPRPSTHGTGDVDKLERNVLDGLQDAGTLVNDAQVTDVAHKKRWCGSPGADVLDVPGAVIRIYPMGDE